MKSIKSVAVLLLTFCVCLCVILLYSLSLYLDVVTIYNSVGVGVWIQENRDPRKLSPLLELLLDNPLSGDGGSASDSGLAQFYSVVLNSAQSCLLIAQP